MQHFWSLAVEEQFYLVWPALILLAFALPMAGTRRRWVMVGGVLGAVTAASFAWSVHATGASPGTAYFSTFTRAWELGLGALVAVAAPQLQQVPAALRAVLAWCGLGGVLASVFLVDEGTPFPGTAALLVAWGGAPGGPGTRWLLASAPAGFLGAISYSLHLWHWPVLIIAGALVLSGSAVFSDGVIGVSVLLASFSYYCIEQPVLHTNWLLSHRPVDPVRARRVFVRARRVGLAAVGAGAVAAWTLVAVPPAGGGPARRRGRHLPGPRRPIRLVGAVLAEQHDEWTEGRRYLGLDVLARCRIQPAPDTASTGEEVTAQTIPALSA